MLLGRWDLRASRSLSDELGRHSDNQHEMAEYLRTRCRPKRKPHSKAGLHTGNVGDLECECLSDPRKFCTGKPLAAIIISRGSIRLSGEIVQKPQSWS